MIGRVPAVAVALAVAVVLIVVAVLIALATGGFAPGCRTASGGTSPSACPSVTATSPG